MKLRTADIVASGASSISQCPAFGTTSSVTLSAALRMTMASFEPNDFAPPIASTGMVSLGLNVALLSSASCRMERNWAKAECIVPGRA